MDSMHRLGVSNGLDKSRELYRRQSISSKGSLESSDSFGDDDDDDEYDDGDD